MESTIKDQVKNIFKTNAFETALELTRTLRGEYIKEFGVKSWNALVTYYKKANIQPVAEVAEPEVTYHHGQEDLPNEKEDSKTPSKKELKKEFDKKIEEISESLKDEIGAIPYEDMMEAFIQLQDEYLGKYGVMLGDKNWKKALALYRKDGEKSKENVQEDAHATTEEVSAVIPSREDVIGEKDTDELPAEEVADVEEAQKEETIEYMLYQNDGEKVDWYGHYVNHNGLKVGESGMMIRMNNLGIGKGKVLATASMTMQEIGIFHKCYASIRQSTLSDKKRVELFTQAFNNLQSAVKDPKFASHSTGKSMTNFILNYKKED